MNPEKGKSLWSKSTKEFNLHLYKNPSKSMTLKEMKKKMPFTHLPTHVVYFDLLVKLPQEK